jgi:hypothetical protein
MTKKTVFTLVVLVFATITSYAQLEEKIKRENVTPGTIIKDGKEIEGFFRSIHQVHSTSKAFPSPWRFQEEVSFITKEDFTNIPKLKGKNYKKYTAKELEGYRYDTLTFESVKYADMSAVGMGMVAKKMFLRKVHSGKISMYHHHATPPNVTTGPGGFDSHYIECGKPNLVYRIGENGKLSLVNSLNIKKELADCPTVVEKHEKGLYKVTSDQEKETGKAEKFLNSIAFRDEVRLLAIEDYNTNCQ